MDGLNNHQRALAWLATWHPSFTGKAILNKDLTFRTANAQFCEILGITPGDLIDKKCQDITPEPHKSLEKTNSRLVIDGKSQGFLLHKIFELPDGRKIPVSQLIAGVYKENGDFDFFVSRIVQSAELSDSIPILKGRTWWDKILIVLTLLAYAIYEIIKAKVSSGELLG